MKRILLRAFFVLGLTFIFGLVGCGASYVIGDSLANGQVAWWTSLGKPPDGATKFVWSRLFPGHGFDLYVEAASGKIYRLDTLGKDLWVEATPPGHEQPLSCGHFQSRLDAIKISNMALDRAIDCTVLFWGGALNDTIAFFVIQIDGSVWIYRNYWVPETDLSLVCGLPLLFELFGWSAIILRNRARKH